MDKESERLADSLQYAQTIQDSYKKAERLNNIAGQFVRLGQLEKASEILAQGLQVVPSIADSARGVSIHIPTQLSPTYGNPNQD